MSYGALEWQGWLLGEEEGIEHIKFAYVTDPLVPRNHLIERADSITESTPSTPLTYTPTACPRSSSGRLSSSSTSLEKTL